MLKISLNDAGQVIQLRLEGRVAGPWTAELRRACAPFLAANRPMELNLAEVSFLDRHGVALLSELRAQGVSLTDCSLFTAEQLNQHQG